MPPKDKGTSARADESSRAEDRPPAETFATVQDRPPAAEFATVQDGAPGAAAGRAIADAVRSSEAEQLRRERDELRGRLGDRADDLSALRAEVDVLRQAAARAGLLDTPRHISEGVRQDLVATGHAVDPATGAALVLDRDSGSVTVTDRHGRVSTMRLDPPAPVAPSETG